MDNFHGWMNNRTGDGLMNSVRFPAHRKGSLFFDGVDNCKLETAASSRQYAVVVQPEGARVTSHCCEGCCGLIFLDAFSRAACRYLPRDCS